jgi:hypothetical protein
MESMESFAGSSLSLAPHNVQPSMVYSSYLFDLSTLHGLRDRVEHYCALIMN